MSSAYRRPPFGQPAGFIPTGLKWLLIANIGVFLIQFLLYYTIRFEFRHLKLIPFETVTGFLWQPFTYMFLHDVNSTNHIFWNMVSLFFTAQIPETSWGTQRFLKYYLYCGVGAAICVIVAAFVMGTPAIATVGASGAIFGILIAYYLVFPNVLFFGVIKAKWFVLIIGSIQILDGIASGNSRVSYVAHLGGMLAGYLLIKFGFLQSRSSAVDPASWLSVKWKEWRLARARRKFEVYMRRRDGR